GGSAPIIESEAVNQRAQGEKVVGENGLTRAHHGGHVDRGGDRNDNQDHRDDHHHLEEREALGTARALGVLPNFLEASRCAIHEAPTLGRRPSQRSSRGGGTGNLQIPACQGKAPPYESPLNLCLSAASVYGGMPCSLRSSGPASRGNDHAATGAARSVGTVQAHTRRSQCTHRPPGSAPARPLSLTR